MDNYCVICVTGNSVVTHNFDYEYQQNSKSEPARCRVIEKNVDSEYAKFSAKKFTNQLSKIDKKYYKMSYKAVPMKTVTHAYSKENLIDY